MYRLEAQQVKGTELQKIQQVASSTEPDGEDGILSPRDGDLLVTTGFTEHEAEAQAETSVVSPEMAQYRNNMALMQLNMQNMAMMQFQAQMQSPQNMAMMHMQQAPQIMPLPPPPMPAQVPMRQAQAQAQAALQQQHQFMVLPEAPSEVLLNAQHTARYRP